MLTRGTNPRPALLALPCLTDRADLTKAEREALAFIYDLRNKFESGEIPLEEGQGGGVFGAIKRAFEQ